MPTAHETVNDRVSIREGFLWDAQDAYLFDIDGTLLRSRDRIHIDSFATSVQQVTGLEISLTGIALSGSTDTAILQAIRNSVLDRRAEMDLWTMPGVEETLAHLANKGALLGLATGNLELIGWAKVEEVGLREWFRFGGFSDRFSLRSAMVGDAAAKARELMPDREGASVCVVGDTPRDIEAARSNGLPVIAVATCHFSFDELATHEPDVCTSSLTALLAQTQMDAEVRR
jgi:phosphoglycolate phosphatase